MDEVVMSVTAFGGAIFAAGVGFGVLLGYVFLPGERRARRLQDELDALKREASGYRADVSKHFYRTAELVAGLTNSYKAVYDHLASGARTLADVPTGANALPFADTKLLVGETTDEADAAAKTETEGPPESNRGPAVEDDATKAA